MWAFDFSPAMDEEMGLPVKYDVDDLVGGITVEPRHYGCTITPRSSRKADIIRAEAEKDTRKFLDAETGQCKETSLDMAFSSHMPEEVEA